MDIESDVRDNAKKVVFISGVFIDSIIEIGCKKDLWSRSLAELSLVLVQGFLQKLSTLFEDEFVEFGKVGRIEPHRVLDQKYGLGSYIQDIVVGIFLVLE